MGDQRRKVSLAEPADDRRTGSERAHAKRALREWSAWAGRAACRELPLTLFFPPGNSDRTRVDEARAKAVCSSCPVRVPCLVFALTREEAYGVWGGLTADERRVLETTGLPAAKAVIDALGPGPPILEDLYTPFASWKPGDTG
jgi:WhiB family transcriptional regulator, redox-sensing transcriptional regulator